MNQDIFVLIEHLRGAVADISYIMLAQAREIAASTGGKVVGIVLCNNGEVLTKNMYADNVLIVSHPILKDFTWDGYMTCLEDILVDKKPRLLLLGDSSVGTELASGLSARLDLPLLSYCSHISAEGSKLIATSQICGGKLMAESEISEKTTLVTMIPGKFRVEGGKNEKPHELTDRPVPDFPDMRVKFIKLIEPAGEDIDITQFPVLIAVGRGLEEGDNLEPIEELASVLNAAVCASRPVIDQGWLPMTRLVGKSGLSIKPKLLLSLGISGAPEHTESITSSELIIAVNTDPRAPIFDLAKYGAVVDMHDLVEVLLEQVQEAKETS